MASSEPTLRLKLVTLEKNSTCELDGVSLAFYPGTIHCILGKYGSGKSALVRIIRGTRRPTGGQLIVGLSSYDYFKVKDSLSLGIAVIQHDDRFIENMKVKEYLYDKFYYRNTSIISGKRMSSHFSKLRKHYDLPDYGEQLLSRIPISDKFYLSLIKSIDQNPRLLVLDEILDKMNTVHLARTIRILRECSSRGLSVVLITNNIDEVYTIAERASILKNGRIIYDDDINKIEKINLIKLAFIEISKSDQDKIADQTFYQLLKYNEAILLELPINLLIVDKEMTVKIANKSARSFFVLGESEYLNKPLIHIFEKNIHAFDAIANAFVKRDATIIHNLIITLNGFQYHTSIKTYPIFEGADFIGFIVAIEDVTEQENTRDKLFMSENLASVGLLSAGVAHEINNPLEIISNCASFLGYHLKDSDLQKKIESIKNEVYSISKIISNLVGITHQKKAFTSKLFSLNEMVSNLIDLLSQNALNQMINIRLIEQPEELFIQADITEIKQVLLNIIKNSIEAISGKGSIDIYLYRLDNRTVEIIIEDSGNGIDESLIKNIFLPFYSNKNTGAQNQGLGLYISYSIVKKYNGNITVKNMLHGCRFSITLPVLEDVNSFIEDLHG